MKRRTLLHASAALGVAAGLGGCATAVPAKARVLVVGGGYGGATAARYVRIFSDHKVDVVMVEPNAAFVSCPLSNLVVGGSKQMADITVPYSGLTRAHGVQWVQDTVAAIDFDTKTARLANGATIAYDKLVLSPGIDFMPDRVEGLAAAYTSGAAIHAWKAGPDTLALRRQLEAMPDGGTFVIAIPEAPYRCPPGPYERACQVAWYLKRAKPRAKLLVLDANPDVTSKPALFKKAWADNYAGILEYRANHKLTRVDGAKRTLAFEVHDEVRADVLNVLPPMRAGAIATPLATMAGNRWCGVDFRTFESTVRKDVHVLGDSTLSASGMPKSGHMANQHGKVAAAAIVSQLNGWEPPAAPVINNTCYSFVDDRNVIHVASVHEYFAPEKTFRIVAGSGGVSTAPSETEGSYAFNWARNIWSDMLA
ncbi:FCSD flavin-binding domain-containing protein [Ramlibacter albus]|uniref:FCSD flavin-binding domain-containing protein n=1 Tax=Ramlibacter albus TaxID=2079448 RepID=A0A923MBK4_9BURK|nr:FCSD flavin-binding domain-containing protein [Ramlibacter albus]MBC5766511.1 FCSD flavin-binding domain-containing protein [Ramlibacter albus]